MVLADLEKEKKDLLASAVEKEKLLRVRWQPMDKPCRPIADTTLGQGQDHWKPRPRVCACFRQRGQPRTTPAHGKAVSSDIQQDNNVVERTWAPEGVTFEKRDVLSRRSCVPAS